MVGVLEGVDDVGGSDDEVRITDEEVEGAMEVGGLVEVDGTVGEDASAVVLDDGADVDGEAEAVVGEDRGEALVLVEFPDIVNRRVKVSLRYFLYIVVSVRANLHDAVDNADDVLTTY